MIENFREITQLQPNTIPAFFDANRLYGIAAAYAMTAGYNVSGLLSDNAPPELWDAQYIDPTGEKHGMHTMDALRCLIDLHRTQVLLAGIGETVSQLQQQGKKYLVAIDAGTGTGVLSLGLIAAGCSEVYALEINGLTAIITAQFMQECGLSDRIHVVTCDATKIDSLPQTDILVSENLSNGLLDEPQQEIIQNLSHFLTPGAPIIPYRAQCFVALGRANWDSIPESSASARKLPDLQRYTDLSEYADIVSAVGQNCTLVEGQVNIDTTRMANPANTLIVLTRFQINGIGAPNYLEPDSAKFLGQSSAFKLQEEIKPGQGLVQTHVKYRPGIHREFLKTQNTENQISLFT